MALDDQLIYPLVFWNDVGGCGTIGEESIQGSTSRIRKVSICLTLQGKDHFIHGLGTLREGFL
jgi:hypothetical protein